MNEYSRLPKHIGIIPDGNRRWAAANNMTSESGYEYGMEKGKVLFQILYDLDIDEVTVYAFTKDNTKRRSHVTDAYVESLIGFLDWIVDKDVSILAVGDHTSSMFPEEFIPFIEPESNRTSKQKINFLVNYDWNWDLETGVERYRRQFSGQRFFWKNWLPSGFVSRVDLLIRWGGQRRLSGFPPLQTVYTDIYVVDTMWPDFQPSDVYEALEWYQTVDVTLGG